MEYYLHLFVNLTGWYMYPELPENELDFHGIVLQETLYSIKANRFLDNFDYRRFGTALESRPNLDKSFIPANAAGWLDWYFRNRNKLFVSFQALEDNYSKRLYLSLISYKIGGHLSVKIPVEFSENDEDIIELRRKLKYEDSKLEAINKKELSNIKLKHVDFEFKNRKYVVDCNEGALESYLHRKQYFFERKGERIKPEKGDVVLDCGAFLGDTSVVFGNSVGMEGKVFAFDPLSSHLAIINHNIRQNPNLNIVAVPFGVSNKSVNKEPVVFDVLDPGFNVLSDSNTPLVKIDDFVKTNSLDSVDFVKMDIEGSELSALTGAMETLKRFKPKLAISIYHGSNDFFEIINYLSASQIYSKFFIGHYTIHNEETVLYCSN